MKKLLLATTLIASFTANANWRNLDSSDDLTGEIIYTSGLISEKGDGALIFRCKAGDLDLIYKFSRYLGSESRMVKYKIDSGDIRTDYHSISTSGQALFSYTPAETIKELANAKKLVARTERYGGSDVTLVFNLTGVKQESKRILSKCGK